ncbi:MAG: helix-turn-helix transcriptional regulator [Bacteroidota bacterium]
MDVIKGGNDSPNVNLLTVREVQIVNLIMQGASSPEIANAFFISIKTVEVHRHNILKKLKLRNAASLVNFINSNVLFIIAFVRLMFYK